MKVGIFDSGLGGLTIVHAISELIQGAELFYIADTKNAPYGESTPKQILQYSLDITQKLIEKHQIEALIIACNTATSAAIHALRSKYPELIIIGTEPGIKPAIEQTVSHNVGVLATPATLKGLKYQKLAHTLAHKRNVKLFEQSCPGLVEQIEKGEIDTPKTLGMLEQWLAPMRENSVDTIVLGCTHYPLVSKSIKNIMQKDVTLIHTGEAIAKHLLYLAQKKSHLNKGELKISLYSTGEINESIVHTIFDKAIKVKRCY